MSCTVNPHVCICTSVEKQCVMHCTYLQDLGGKVPAHDYAALFLLDLHILMQRMGNGVMHWFSLDMNILTQLWRADVMH